MTKAGKITLLSMTILLLAVLVIELRKRLPSAAVPAASLTDQEVSESDPPSTRVRVTQQPTILRANPIPGERGVSPLASPVDWGPERSSVAPQAETRSSVPRAYIPTGRPLFGPPFEMSAVERSQEGGPNVHSQHTTVPVQGGPIHGWPGADDLTPTGTISGESASPASEGGEPVRQPTSVYTQAEDSFWKISQRVYGVGDYYKALYVHNRGRVARPDRIPAGLEIFTPAAADLIRWYPDCCPKNLPDQGPRIGHAGNIPTGG